MTGDRPGSEAWQGATKRPRGYSNATTSADGQQMTRLATAVETYFETCGASAPPAAPPASGRPTRRSRTC